MNRGTVGKVEQDEKRRTTLQSFSCMEKTQIMSSPRMRKSWKEWRMGGLNHTVWVRKIKMSQHGSSTQYDFYGYPHILESLKDVVIVNACIFFYSRKGTLLLKLSSLWNTVVIWLINISWWASRGTNKIAPVFSTRLEDVLRKQSWWNM